MNSNELQQQSTACTSSSRKQSTTSLVSQGSGHNPPMLEQEDGQQLEQIKMALRSYRKYASEHINRREIYLNSLPKRHQDIMAKYRKHLSVLRDCIRDNQAVYDKMLVEDFRCENTIGNAVQENDGHAIKIRHQDIENAQSTLKLFARDWSTAGAEEREQCYKPIIDAIEEFYKPSDYEVNEIKVLVPGAGLGRLTYELACRGYECEGNEYSYFMMIASNFVLNQCNKNDEYTLYPWVHHYDNNLRMADPVMAIRFPDVCPKNNKPKGNLKMGAGDFLTAYDEPNVFDCVATCFFIDCANNVMDFIETIYRILVPGGIWVNLGPLLYHFSSNAYENSIEPTYENLLHIIENVGFEILRHKSGVRTKYAQNPLSMLKSEYESLFWICRKPLNAQRDDDANETVGCDMNDGHNNGGRMNYQNGFDAYRH